jgi:hypothetical protein
MTVSAFPQHRSRTAPADARVYTTPFVREIPRQIDERLRSTVW